MCISASVPPTKKKPNQKQSFFGFAHHCLRTNRFFCTYLTGFLIAAIVFATVSYSVENSNGGWSTQDFRKQEEIGSAMSQEDKIKALMALIEQQQKELEKLKSAKNNATSLDAEFVPMDRVPLSLGVEHSDGTMEVIIGRNMKLPVKVSQTMPLRIMSHYRADVRIFEGERLMAKDNRFLRELRLHPIAEPCPLGGEVEVELTFEISADRTLRIEAKTSTGIKIGIALLHYKKRLYSRGEVQRLVNEAHSAWAEDNQQVMDQQWNWGEKVERRTWNENFLAPFIMASLCVIGLLLFVFFVGYSLAHNGTRQN